MKNIRDFAIPNIIYLVRKKRDSQLLIKHLREGGEVTTELANLIADILEGKINARPKSKKYLPSQEWAKINVSCWKTILYGEEKGINWKDVIGILKDRGINQPPETKGEITKIAEKLTAEYFELTQAQLDEILRPRKSRPK